MSTSKAIFIIAGILLMIYCIVSTSSDFDNGNELKAIFDLTAVAAICSGWAWVLAIIKD